MGSEIIIPKEVDKGKQGQDYGPFHKIQGLSFMGEVVKQNENNKRNVRDESKDQPKPELCINKNGDERKYGTSQT